MRLQVNIAHLKYNDHIHVYCRLHEKKPLSLVTVEYLYQEGIQAPSHSSWGSMVAHPGLSL